MASAKKKKKIVPTTPAKKNKAHFGASANELYSPISNTLKFEEDPKSLQMVVKLVQGASNRFLTEYQVIEKLGEGCFGEAFLVRSKTNGQMYAIKKAKQKYIGLRDREQK